MSNSSPPAQPSEEGAPSPGSAELDVASPNRPGLADWLDLLSLLRLDEGGRDAELRRRDRAIGAALEERFGPAASRPERWLVAWVRTRRTEHTGGGLAEPVPGVRTADAVGWAAALLGLGGLLFGASAALGAFAFQPQGRINVVAVLGVLVGLPTLFLVMALLNALPVGVRRALPLIGSEPEGGGLLQPARWAMRALPQSAREALDSAWARGQGFERLAAPVQRWLMLSASQGAAVAFQVGALGTALALVVFSDLSFGWSTTLDVGTGPAHAVTRILSAPWAWAWPAAVPSAELVGETRFFRIASKLDPGISPARFGEWWRFVVMSIAVYGLLPRLCFFAFARAKLQRGLVRATLDAPGARRLLARMQAPLVETGRMGDGANDTGEAAGEPFETGDEAGVPWPARAVWVSWAEALEQAGPGATDASGPVLSAGGRLAASVDAQTALEAGARGRSEDLPVAVVVRGFEPPVLEIVDFLADLRRALGDGREIVVGLVGGDAGHARTWRRKLAQTGDPWIVCTGFEPGRDPGAPEPEPLASSSERNGGEDAS